MGDIGGLVRVQQLLTLCIALLACPAAPLIGQAIRGTVRAEQMDVPLADARIVVSDSSGRSIADGVSDGSGRFNIAVPPRTVFQLTVKKIGWRPSHSEWIRIEVADTLEIDLRVPADLVALGAVEIRGSAADSRNARALAEARRRGWKTFAPELVAMHRETAQNFTDLLRAVGAPVQVPTRAGDCVRSRRDPTRCLVYVVDGTVAGPNFWMNPREVYFFSVLSSTESAVQFGDRAPWGAIVVTTRMNGDMIRPEDPDHATRMIGESRTR